MLKSNEKAIPITNNCVFSINLDFTKKSEKILIGERDEVIKYLNGNDNANILFSVSRDIGRFMQDVTPIYPIGLDLISIFDVKVILLESIGKKKSPYFAKAIFTLEAYYHSGNPVYCFTALLLWQEYHRACKSKNVSDAIIDTFDDITLPLRFNIMEDVKHRQEMNKKNPVAFMERDFTKHQVSLLYDYSKDTKEYGASSISVLPLVIYYLKRIYENGKYLQTCPMCDNVFIAKTAGMTTYCSDECKKKSGRENKRRFDEKAKRTSYERASKNAYMYWYNKIVKLRKDSNLPKKKLDEAEALFNNYTLEATSRKKDVVNKKTDADVFENWLLMQRNVIDDFLDSIGE